MKMLEDLWSSMTGNVRAKVGDPFLGAFVVAWVACNWNHLAILFWGDGKASERINTLHIYLSSSPLAALNAVFVFPFLISIFYVFLFPWVSLFFKFMQKTVNGRLHQQAVKIELDKLERQESLNKARLRSNPDKRFLEQILQLDIDREKEQVEILRQDAILVKEKADEALANASEAKARESVVLLDEVSKQRHSDLERERFGVDSAKLRATLASQRFPSAYLYMSIIDSNLRADGISISLAAAGEIVAAVFGYEDFQAVIDDKGFNNSALAGVAYVYYESAVLANRLEIVVQGEQHVSKKLTSEFLFDHVLMMFEELPFSAVDDDGLEDICRRFFEENRYSVFDCEGVSGAIADSDTIFDEIEFESVESVQFDSGIAAVIDVSAWGNHRKHENVPGRSMSISIEIKSSLLVGRFALGEFEFVEVNGGLDDFESEVEEAY